MMLSIGMYVGEFDNMGGRGCNFVKVLKLFWGN